MPTLSTDAATMGCELRRMRVEEPTMARRKKVTTPTMVAAEGHGGCCEETVIGRSGDGDDLLRRERDASDSDLENDDMEERLIGFGGRAGLFRNCHGAERTVILLQKKSPNMWHFLHELPLTHVLIQETCTI